MVKHDSAEDKARIVLCVLRGELSQAEAARWSGVSSSTVGRWTRMFVSGGTTALGAGSNGVALESEQAA